MPQLVMIRHGESLWNKENKFTGWMDVGLSEKGLREAQKAGQKLREKGFHFDIAYTSFLKRAIKTLWLILDEMDLLWLEEVKTWQLNERHYGKLQGLNKQETAQKYGDKQVFQWRRSYHIAPPALSIEHSGYEKKPYSQFFTKTTIPLSESLKDCQKRVLPFWNSHIKPSLQIKKNVLLVAHGNSLRALVQFLERISEEAISQVNIDTGKSLIYKLDENQNILKKSVL